MNRDFPFYRTGLCTVVVLVFILATGIFADDGNGDTGKVVLTGSGYHETGQLYHGRWQGTNIPRQWLMREQANVGGSYICNEYLRLSLGIGAMLWFETYPDAMRNPANSPRKQYFSVFPAAAEGVFSYNKWDMVKLEMELGYFPFQYNPDTRNLGSYLFRCGAYPPYVTTNIDQVFSRLAGIHIKTDLFDMVHVHALFTQECEMPTFYDPSLSFLADVDYKKIIDVGGGIMFCRFWPVNSGATANTTDSRNKYTDPSLPDSTGYYTFAGTKIMLRASFDPKPFFSPGLSRLLGPNDLRLYCEGAILGLKDYPVYYTDSKKRMPYMIGFDVPTFKVLDILALEIENYNWDYSNGYQNPAYYGIATPGQALGADFTQDDYKKDNLKWTVYAKRSFFKHFSVLLLLANDHLVLPAFDEKLSDREEVCGRSSSYYWMVKLGLNF
jgi:hypothetical protein